ncbi:MAG: hypothetical protein ACXAC7_24330, partial [Candidatus Hodarchaeales archaeon]
MSSKKDDDIIEISSEPMSKRFDLMYGNIGDKPLVTKKTHIPFIFPIAMMVVSSLVIMGISSLSSIIYEITGFFSDMMYEFFSLPPILSNFIFGIAALGIGAIILIGVNRGREGAEKIIEGTKIMMDTEPDEYFDLNSVSSVYLVDELLDRGCEGELDPDGGFKIHCKEHPITDKMKEVIHGFDDKYKKQ